MARMYPRTLIEDEVESDGEKRVFAMLRDGLPDEWEAYHSVSWMMSDPAEYQRLRGNARQAFETAYSEQQALPRFEAVLHE